MIHAGTATAVHDVSDGGLLVALAEMAMASGIGAQLLAAPASIVPHAYWFGEDQARYLVTVRAEEAGLVLAKMKGADVPCVRIGTTGGDDDRHRRAKRRFRSRRSRPASRAGSRPI